MSLVSLPEFWVAVLLAIGLTAWAVWFSATQVRGCSRKARREYPRQPAWALLAQRLGFRHSQRDPFSIPRVRSHPLFRRGDDRMAYNVVYGTHRGREVICFEYRYTIHRSQDDDETHECTGVLVRSPFAWPELVVRPETRGDRVRQAVFGSESIDLESDEFNQQFVVECADRRFASDVLHGGTMRFLLTRGPLTIEARGFHVLLYSDPRGVPEGVLELLNDACDFVDLLPEHIAGERASAVSPKGSSIAQPLAQKPAATPGPDGEPD